MEFLFNTHWNNAHPGVDFSLTHSSGLDLLHIFYCIISFTDSCALYVMLCMLYRVGKAMHYRNSFKEDKHIFPRHTFDKKKKNKKN